MNIREFWTFIVLLPRLRVEQPGEKRLFLGPFSQLMRRYVSWFSVDLLATLLAMGLTGLLWRSFGPLEVGWTRAAGLALGFALLFSLSGALLGANRISWSKAAASDALDLLPGALLATAIAVLLNHLVHLDAAGTGGQGVYWTVKPLLPTGMVLTAAGVAFLGFMAARYRGRLITGLATRWVSLRGQASAGRENVLVIGSGETGQFAAWMLQNGHYAGAFRVAGFIDDDLYKQDMRIHGVNVLGQRQEIPALVGRYDVGLIIFAIHNIARAERQELLEICARTPSRVFDFPDIPATLSGLLDESSASPRTTPSGGLPAAALDEELRKIEELAAESDAAEVRQAIQRLRRRAREAGRENHAS